MNPLVRRILSGCAAALLLVSHAAASWTTAKVIAVHDGDTVTVQIPRARPFNVRLNGIDAPELAQAFGPESRDYLAARALNQTIFLEMLHLDRYGRMIGRLLLNGSDLNLEQIKTGNAWCYRAYLRDLTATNKALYRAAEDGARSGSTGLWQAPTPLAPWLYRKAHRYTR